MEFIVFQDTKGALKIAYHYDEIKRVEFNLEDLFINFINHDVTAFYEELKSENIKLKTLENKDLELSKKIFNEICLNNLPYPLNTFFYLFLSEYIDPKDISFDNIIKNSEEDYSLSIKRTKMIYESVLCGEYRILSKSLPFKWLVTVNYVNGMFCEFYNLSELEELAEFCMYQVIKTKIQINKCANCGKYFIPHSKSSETYCNNKYKGNRTCKQIGYENKIKSNEFMNAYRTAYKIKNIIKNKYIATDIHAEEDFKKWVTDAKQKLKKAMDGKISLEEFKEWLKQ